MADPYSMQYKALTEEDIFDMYGCEYLLSVISDKEVKFELESRIKEIHKSYLAAAKKRAEWVLQSCGIRKTNFDSLRSMADEVTKSFEKTLMAELESPGFDGNALGAIVRAQQAAGVDVSKLGIDLKKIGVDGSKVVKQKRDLSKIGLSEWKEIAKVYFELEDAASIPDIITAIDNLNDLQHCGGNLLVDFQMGYRVGEGKSASGSGQNEAVKEAISNLKKIMDIKRDAKSPMEFIDKMSSDVRKIWAKNKYLIS